MGGPKWTVRLGRQDATSARQSGANGNVPSPFSGLSDLISSFAAKGLSARDVTALSGVHTIGQAQCGTFRSHIYDDAKVNSTFAALRKRNCLPKGCDSNLAQFDLETPNVFDDGCYRDLEAKKGLPYSDQELFNGGSQDLLVRRYSVNSAALARDFATKIF
ncbi:Peroxidase [Musa troglodytarum]|uniref:Peroxidase n=1 Tax=Musa troglodytarum TaxID=320322 RepID=A0A9E7G7S7_9LILI|nr:Peroxidase [Musa troglodytarum]